VKLSVGVLYTEKDVRQRLGDLCNNIFFTMRHSASNMFNKCARTFAVQVEALKKYRSTGEQSIKVQHVNVHDGGQAIVTSTMQTGGGGMEKAMINPMKSAHAAPRCSATSKRTRQPCRAPAVRGWNVCRCHGARGGAPIGKRNGRYRHGRFTKAALAERRSVSKLLREARAGVARLA
jgi:hypothetical protein